MQILNLDLADRSYPIYIGSDLLKQQELIRKHVTAAQVAIVTNETVAPLYLDRVRAALDDYQVSNIILPDGEQFKSLEYLNGIFNQLLEDKHNRTTTLIALGGGVVGDMTGFAAACYQRGIDFVQIPTTLLAQVDSSVGGKTGVNHPLGKNMIGAFHQPKAVLIDTHTLTSLPLRELRAGFAEVIKYGLLCDREFFTWLEKNYQKVLDRDEQALGYAIEKSCRNKAKIVEGDEREAGLRATLNLGHTFGHAIETFQGYGDWLHGEAVAAGMVMALDLSYRAGWLAKHDAQRGLDLIRLAGLPIAPPKELTGDKFVQLMSLDKKVLDGNLRLVLLEEIGHAIVTSKFPVAQFHQTLEAGAELCC